MENKYFIPDIEIWKDIPEYEGLYQISNLGNIKSLKREVKHNYSGSINLKTRILKSSLGGKYLRVAFCKESKYKYIHVHRILALMFIENPDNLPEVNHIDGNKLNNKLENLEWVTRKENMFHAFKNGLAKSGENCYNSKISNLQVIEIKKRYSKKNISQKQLAKEYKVDQALISRIINNKIHKKW